MVSKQHGKLWLLIFWLRSWLLIHLLHTYITCMTAAMMHDNMPDV